MDDYQYHTFDLAGWVLPVNAYVLPYADVVIDAPSSSELNLTDKSVPFFQMVVHGFIDYAGDPLNFSHDMEYELLKMIETGAYPYFTLMYEDNSVLKNTDFDYLLSTNYKRWLLRMSEIYSAVNHALAPVKDQRIVSHEEIVDGVFKTTYENGYSTIVNYREEPVIIGDIEVDRRSFRVITLPMMSPLILTNIVYTIIDSFTANNNQIVRMIRAVRVTGAGYGISAAMSWIYFALIAAVLGIVIGVISKRVFYME